MRRSLGSAARLRLFAILTAIAALAAVGLASSASAGTGAQLTITPTSKNFGSVVVGSSNGPFTFTVKNIGTQQMSGLLQVSVTGANAAEFSPPGGSCTPTNTVKLGPGDTCTVTITFTPGATASGNRNANLKVSATPGGAPSAALSGTALNAVLSIAPTSWNFGSVGSGTSSTAETFTITNTGAAKSGAITFTKSGANAAEFIATGSGGNACDVAGGTTTLDPGLSCTFDVTFNPALTASGNRNAKVTASASPGGTVSTSLSGTALNAVLSITPTSWNFGSVTAGSTSSKTFVVTNTGGATSGTLTIALSGGDASQFSIVVFIGSCVNGSTLDPGDSCNVYARFSPDSSASGNKHADLNVSASPGGNVHASLTGNALNAQLSISPSSYNFDSVAVNGASATYTFTVTNIGSAISGAISFSKSGGAAGDYAIAAGSSGTPCATNGTQTLNAGSNCTIDITFDPSAGGNRNATVTASASPGGNASTSLTGTGTIAKLTISPGNHNFGNAAAGTPVGPFTFTVTNSGTETSAAVTFTVNGSSEFSAVTGATPPGSGCISGATTLAPGASCTIDVTWNSTAPTGDKKARLDVSAGTGEGTPHADLSGKTI